MGLFVQLAVSHDRPGGAGFGGAAGTEAKRGRNKKKVSTLESWSLACEGTRRTNTAVTIWPCDLPLESLWSMEAPRGVFSP